MKVNDYVRTKNGINKIIYIDDIFGSDGKHSFYTIRLENDNLIFEDEVIISSPKIIDLIEVGDIISWETKYNNGINEVINYLGDIGVYAIEEDTLYTLQEIKIKSILTHEQFETMKYKVVE